MTRVKEAKQVLVMIFCAFLAAIANGYDGEILPHPLRCVRTERVLRIPHDGHHRCSFLPLCSLRQG